MMSRPRISSNDKSFEEVETTKGVSIEEDKAMWVVKEKHQSMESIETTKISRPRISSNDESFEEAPR